MVTTVKELLQVIRSNPFIDGIGYFIEVTTAEPLPEGAAKRISSKLQDAFCQHAQATVEGEDVLGLDFHEHIFTQGEGSEDDLGALESILRFIEAEYGIDHLCIELQFDLGRAREARKKVDELLKP